MRLGILVSKIPLFITILIGDLTYVLIFLLQWLVAVIIVLRRGLNYIDSNRRSEVLKSGDTKITIGFSIALTFLIVLTRFLGGCSIFRVIGRQNLCFF